MYARNACSRDTCSYSSNVGESDQREQIQFTTKKAPRLASIYSSVLLHCLYSEGEKQNLVARLTPYIYRLGFGFEKSNLAHLTFPFNLQRKNSIHKSVAQLIQNPKVIYTSAFIQLRKRIRKLTPQKTHSVARQRTKFDIKAMLVHWNGISDIAAFFYSALRDTPTLTAVRGRT